MISVSKSNYSTFAGEHEEAIINFCSNKRRRSFKKNQLDKDIKSYFGGIVNDLSELLMASPEELFKLMVYFDGKTATVRSNIRKKLDLKDLYDRFIKSNSPYKLSNGIIYNSSYLAQKIDIKTCPYCNENASYSFYYKSANKYRRTFDWDHIIPKDKYPFLAISFYNLIPACKVCNHLKLNKIIDISPHDNFNPDKTYSFRVKGKNMGFISDSSSINLLLKVKSNKGGKALINAMEKVGLDARLATNTDLVKDILNKKIIYKSSYWNSLENFVAKNSKSKIKLLDLFFSAYFNPEDYYKRPYSKLTSDLLKSS